MESIMPRCFQVAVYIHQAYHLFILMTCETNQKTCVLHHQHFVLGTALLLDTRWSRLCCTKWSRARTLYLRRVLAA